VRSSEREGKETCTNKINGYICMSFYNNKEVAAIVIPMAAAPKMVAVEAALVA
jgi:hypothetical protein